MVLGGGLGVPRVIHAVKLYEKGLAPIIILTGQEMEFDGRKFRYKDIKLTEPPTRWDAGKIIRYS